MHPEQNLKEQLFNENHTFLPLGLINNAKCLIKNKMKQETLVCQLPKKLLKRLWN